VLDQPNGQLIPRHGDPIPLWQDFLVLGRRESCDIPLRFPNVSQEHAQLVFHKGYWYIRDLNSTNGIKVNGCRVIIKQLWPNDEITIGKRGYRISYSPPRSRPDDGTEDQGVPVKPRPTPPSLSQSTTPSHDPDPL
jgi:pSer/pThr/pTyr-binding forkhead associated (FHA) protein